METSPQKNSRPATVERITTAARQVFYEKGFFAATVDQIAREGKVSRATVYLHFKTKDEMLFVLLEEDLEYQLKKYEELLAITRLSNASVRKWLCEFCDYIASQHQSLDLFWTAGALRSGRGDMAVRHRDKIIALLGQRFKGFDIDALGRSDRKVHRAKCHMMLYLIEGVSMHFREQKSLDIELGVELLAPMMLEFLRTGQFTK